MRSHFLKFLVVILSYRCSDHQPHAKSLQEFLVGNWHAKGYAISFEEDSLRYSYQGELIWEGEYRLAPDSTIHFDYDSVARKIAVLSDGKFEFIRSRKISRWPISVPVLETLRFEKEKE